MPHSYRGLRWHPTLHFPQPHSPHRVEVIIRGHIVLIITGQPQLIPITLVDEVPELLGAQGLWGEEQQPDLPPSGPLGLHRGTEASWLPGQ